jgi:4-amino-4-deoxy-L-arabinose transferase-like glycosyltransferase
MLWPVSAPITNVDEARYSEASREMLESGNFVIPHHNYEPRYEKPIMIYWLQAASMALFGVNAPAARLPSALAAIALVLLVHWFLLTWLPSPDDDDQLRRGTALLCSFALATMPLLAIWARVATTDVVLTLFTTGSLLALLHAQLVEGVRGPGTAAPEPPDLGASREVRWAYIIASACAALAFLTKGPIGVAIPAGVWLVYVLMQRRLRLELKRIPWLWVIAVFIVIAAPWYVATYVVDGSEFITQFFVSENVDRFTGKEAAPIPVPRLTLLVAYLPISFLFLFPWSVFLIRDLRRPLGGSNGMKREPLAGQMRRFGWIWMAVVVCIFSLSRNQSPNYVQSIIAPAAILLGLHLLARFVHKDAGVVRIFWGEILGLAVGMVVWVGLVFWVIEVGSVQRPLVFPPLMGLPNAQPFPRSLCTLMGWGSALLAGALVASFVGRAPERRERGAFGSAAVVWWLFIALFAMVFSPMLSNSAHALTVEVGTYLRNVGHDQPIWVYTEKRQDALVFYSQRRLRLLSQESVKLSDELLRARIPDSGIIVGTDDRGIAEATSVGDVEVLQRFDATTVVRVRAADGEPKEFRRTEHSLDP